MISTEWDCVLLREPSCWDSRIPGCPALGTWSRSDAEGGVAQVGVTAYGVLRTAYGLPHMVRSQNVIYSRRSSHDRDRPMKHKSLAGPVVSQLHPCPPGQALIGFRNGPFLALRIITQQRTNQPVAIRTLAGNQPLRLPFCPRKALYLVTFNPTIWYRDRELRKAMLARVTVQ